VSPNRTKAAAVRTSVLTCHRCGARNRVGPIERGAPACGRCHERLAWIVDADEGDFAAQSAASVPVLVDLWAAWCGPCRAVAPALARLAERHAGRLKVVKVDVDRNPALAARFEARSIPLLVVLAGGREVDRIVGALPPEALERRITPFLEPS
jgi:thioredoxin 2